ncbi:MAG: hypothetical protein IJB32_04890 [Clostridia bacterium]|nr:hypothetical protein [Clostridia bacterium]
MRYEKVYVGVIVKFFADGGMRPMEIIWTDGQRFSVDRIKYIERAPSKVGGLLTKRFTVIVSGFEKRLYYEEKQERWFVERKIE